MLRIEKVTKIYPGTVALDDVSVSFPPGKIHALLGKNGAGKSTLVKIIAGAEQPTRGKLFIDDREVVMNNAEDAFRQGIATVYQEMSLVPGLTVAENIFIGRMPRKLGGMVLDWKAAFERAQALVDEYKVNIDVKKRVMELGVAQRQMVEIVKAMSFNPSVVMLDEPTSTLAKHETDMLFKMVQRLAAKGVCIIYITHRLQELKHIADDITVLRDGKLIGTMDMAVATPEKIIAMMFGETERRHRPSDLKVGNGIAMEVKNLGLAGKFHDVNFAIRKGEILGLAGLIGSGRSELLRAIFGVEPWDSGEVWINGVKVRRGEPADMKRYGLAMTPEDRKETGLVQVMSIHNNLALSSLDKNSSRLNIMNRRRERESVRQLVEKLQIRLPGLEQPVSSLSGGNQQKVVVGKWVATEPRIFLFDEPTRGIDVVAKQQIFEMMWKLSRDGLSCLFVSSELEELVEVCHRILIMKHGTIVEELDADSVLVDELYVKCMA